MEKKEGEKKNRGEAEEDGGVDAGGMIERDGRSFVVEE